MHSFTSKSLDGDGIVDIKGLAPGKYTVKETKAPTINDITYALDDSGITFTLNADNTVTVNEVNAVTKYLQNTELIKDASKYKRTPRV